MTRAWNRQGPDAHGGADPSGELSGLHHTELASARETSAGVLTPTAGSTHSTDQRDPISAVRMPVERGVPRSLDDVMPGGFGGPRRVNSATSNW